MRILSLIIWTLVLMWPSSQDTKGWRGIVPLRSTRADVEALLGQGTGAHKDSYYLDDMNIFFSYASGDCESGGSGNWNIPSDTVIRFTIYPKPNPKLSDLRIDESKFEKRPNTGDGLIYVDNREGLGIAVQRGVVNSFDYGPAAGEEYLRCPGYDGISYSASIPKELRHRILQRLDQFVNYSLGREYEKQYLLFLPEVAAKMFPGKNAQEFGEWARNSGDSGNPGDLHELFVEFKPSSITESEDKTYGKVYEVFGLAVTSTGGKTLQSSRTTEVVMKNNVLYFVDLFRLIPL